MSIDFGNTELTELTPKIAVIGVGGAGCNAVNNMIRAQLQGVDFIVANTDAQSLANAEADNRVQLGVEITQGLGAGAQPKVGQAAAEEACDTIDEVLNGCHMAFVTAGMGGGTGTGAAPVIARRAREKGILTVGVVTRPFHFEGGRRMKIADAGIQELAQHVDTLIIIPNQNLFRVANERTTFADAFKMADEVLHSGVRGVTDLMVMPGLINLDFADVRTVMSEMGKAMMGTGEAEGENRAQEAAAAAISNPLLEEASLKGARGVIINVTGGMDMTLYEVDEAVNMVREQADPDALIVFGSAFSPDLEGTLRVSVVATGIEGGEGYQGLAPAPVREKAPEAVGEAEASEPDEVADEAPVSGAEEADASEAEEEIAVDTEERQEEKPFSLNVPSSEDDTQEEEAVEDDIEAQAVAAQGDDAFVAPPAMTPKASQPSFKQADIFQEAAYASGPKEKEAAAPVQEAPKKAIEPQKRSLFQLMTAGLRGDDTTVPPVQHAEPANEVAEPKKEASLGGVTAEERPAPAASKDQQDMIPSFLRRQQN